MTALNRIMMAAEPIAYGATAQYPYSDSLAKKFTGISRFKEPYALYRRTGNVIHLPRAVCPVGQNDNRSDGVDVQFQCNFKPRDADQAHFVSASLAFLKKGLSGISEAPTGKGKTAMAMPVIAGVGKKTLIICTKEDLMLSDDQWLGALRQFLKLPDKDIGVVRQDRCDVAGKKAVIGLVHSLAIENRYPPGTFDDFGLIVWDEVHRMAAESFSNTAFLFPALRRWGLSATPDRKDGKEVVLHANIGPIRVRIEALPMTPKVLHFTSSWKCPRVVRKDPDTGEQKIVRLPHGPGRVTHIVKRLMVDDARNDLICKATMMAYSKKRQIVVFSELLDHLEAIRLGLKNMGAKWDEMAMYVGGQSDPERLTRPLTLTTYAMMAEGTNAPWKDTAVFATPRGDVRQIAGRVLREHPNKPKPILIDITDPDSPVFAGYANSRRSWYRAIGAEQVYL